MSRAGDSSLSSVQSHPKSLPSLPLSFSDSGVNNGVLLAVEANEGRSDRPGRPRVRSRRLDVALGSGPRNSSQSLPTPSRLRLRMDVCSRPSDCRATEAISEAGIEELESVRDKGLAGGLDDDVPAIMVLAFNMMGEGPGAVGSGKMRKDCCCGFLSEAWVCGAGLGTGVMLSAPSSSSRKDWVGGGSRCLW